MAKDPAFLFYSKDWLEGTAEMLPEEKGIYIDLLCYQHQRGDLPNDLKRLSRLVRLSENDFNKMWEIVSTKFERMDNRLVNRKLSDVMTERSNKGKRNAIIGKFASLLKNANLNKKEYNLMKSQFNLAEFERMDERNVSERLTEWFSLCLKRIENANAIINIDNKEKTEYSKFYDEQIIKSDNNDMYIQFVKFLFGENSIKRPLTKCLNYKDQIGYETFDKYLNLYGKDKIKEKILNLENDTKGKYSSFNLTLNNWLKR